MTIPDDLRFVRFINVNRDSAETLEVTEHISKV
jgi:hypothetical protein